MSDRLKKPEDKPRVQRDWIDEFEIAGGELVDRAKQLVAQGNARRLIIRSSNREVLLEAPLTPALVIGGVAIAFNPMLAALGALAAMIARLKLEIVRVETADDDAALQSTDLPDDDDDGPV